MLILLPLNIACRIRASLRLYYLGLLLIPIDLLCAWFLLIVLIISSVRVSINVRRSRTTCDIAKGLLLVKQSLPRIDRIWFSLRNTLLHLRLRSLLLNRVLLGRWTSLITLCQFLLRTRVFGIAHRIWTLKWILSASKMFSLIYRTTSGLIVTLSHGLRIVRPWSRSTGWRSGFFGRRCSLLSVTAILLVHRLLHLLRLLLMDVLFQIWYLGFILSAAIARRNLIADIFIGFIISLICLNMVFRRYLVDFRSIVRLIVSLFGIVLRNLWVTSVCSWVISLVLSLLCLFLLLQIPLRIPM